MKLVELNRVAEIQRTAATTHQSGTLPYVGLEHIEKGTGHFYAEFTPEPEVLLASKYHFTKDHVLYGKLRPYLNKVVLPNFEGVCSTEILPIKPDPEKLDRRFLWAILLHTEFVDWASQSVTGANLPRLSPSALKSYPIPLPPLDEQRRIAAILEEADHARRLRRYAQDVSDTFLQSVFVEMFGDPVTNPMGWEKIPLKDLCVEIVDCVNRTAPVVEYVTPYKMIRTTNVRNGRIDLENVRYVTHKIFKRWTRRSIPQKGDVILTREAPLGEVGILETDDQVFLGQRLVQYRVNLSKIDNQYLLLALQSEDLQLQMRLAGIGSTVEHLSVPQCKEFLVRVPPLNLQEEFRKIAMQHRYGETLQQEAERQAEHLFQTLLDRAFRGEL